MFQIPSIWYQFKEKTALCKSEYEEGLVDISPELVVNQYNLSIIESGTESIWQMVTQWGIYFSLSWLIAWRMTLSTNVHERIVLADQELKFSNLGMSLVMSLLSLAMAQSKIRMIFY